MRDSIIQTDHVLKSFESVWESGIIPDFETAVPAQAREDKDLLTDLACIDLQNRLQHDTKTCVETYTSAFPQLAQDKLLLLELIRTEFCFHPDRETLKPASYCRRFPDLAVEIKQMFELEFAQSDSSRQPTEFTWQCSSCDNPITNREADQTKCLSCGHPIAIGRYELLRRVGQGAYGYVYLARDPKLDREVAVKIPRSHQFQMPEEVERFLRESRNAAQLDHPGIVRIFDTGRHAGTPYIVSEFVQGQPLSDVLSQQEFDFISTAEFMVSLADAVEHAHQRGVIHRDLKPSNIMTNIKGGRFNPRVMDFGLARRDPIDTQVTLEGQALGTPAYMSPEQARGDLKVVDHRSDIYSLGVIMYQLLCGEVPFRGNAQMLIHQVIHEDPIAPTKFHSRIPKDLATICMKAIHREQSARYASATEFRDDIQRWIEGKPILARPTSSFEKFWRWCRRHPAIASLAATLLVTLTSGIIAVTWQWREAEAARMASENDLGIALESVDKVLGHLGSYTLDDIPQAKQLRADVLNDALAFFQKFRQRNQDDPRVAMQVASAHFQVARIQSALGKTTEAEQAHQAAIQVYESIRKSALDREKWRYETASAYSAYATFLNRQKKRKEALDQQQKCLQLRRELHKEKPDSGKYASKYASARADLGRYLTDTKEIEAEYEAAIDQLKKLDLNSEKIGYKKDLARVLLNYSMHMSEVGKNSLAEKYRIEAIELQEKVIADDPGDESRRAIYANCCLQLVRKLRQESRIEAALVYQDKAVSTYKSLTEDFPATPRHRERYASVLKQVGSLANSQNDQAREIKAYRTAVVQWEVLAALFPSSTSYQRSLAQDLSALAKALISANRLAEAENHLRQKLAIHRTTEKNKPSVRETVFLGTAISELASLLEKLNTPEKSDEASTLREEAENLTSKLGVGEIMEAKLTNRRKIDLLGGLVALARRKGDLELEASSFEAKIKLYHEEVAKAPKKLSRRSSLARQYYYLSQTLSSLQQYEECAKALKSAVKIDSELLKADPNSSTYKTQFVSHNNSLCTMLLRLRMIPEAKNRINQSFELSTKMLASDPDNEYLQLRLAYAYQLTGNVLAKEGKDFNSAKTAYEKALELSDADAQKTYSKTLKPIILNSLAWLLATCPDSAVHNPPRALDLSKQLIQIAPDNGNHISTMAFALFGTADYENALKKFDESTKLNRELGPLNSLLSSICQSKLGQTKKAKLSYQAALSQHQEIKKEPELFERYKEIANQLLGEDGQ